MTYQAVGGDHPADAPTTVIAQSGDTLRIIAQRIFGDGNLWYILASENGLSDPDAALEPGTVIQVPPTVVNRGTSSTSFTPFDISNALGDTTPTQPKPPPPKKKKGCGGLGAILVVVVAVVATVFTAGAAASALGAVAASGGGVMATGAAVFTGGLAVGAGGLAAGFSLTGVAIAAGAVGGALGSLASQGVAIATGLQEGFSWRGVALGAVGGAVGGGLGGSGLLADVSKSKYLAAGINAVGSNAITQGVSIALGLQDKFNWKSLAQTAIAAPIAAYAGTKFGDAIAGAGNSSWSEQAGYSWAKFGRDIASNVTTAGVRAAVGGRFDVQQVVADAFGNAVANSIMDEVHAGSIRKEQRQLDAALTEIGVLKEDAKAVANVLSDPARRAELESRGYNPDKLRSTYVADLASGDVYLDYKNPSNDPVVAAKIDGMKEALAYFGVSRLSDQQLIKSGLDPNAFRSDKSGYYAALYLDETTGRYLLANRGTENLQDLITDIKNSFGGVDAQFDQAATLAGTLIANETVGANITFTGHSLGGGLASVQAAAVDGDAITFNAAGLTRRVAERLDLSTGPESKARVEAIYVKGDLVSGLQDSALTDIAAMVLGTPVKYAIGAVGVLSGQIKPSELNLTFGYVPEAFGTRQMIDASNRVGASPLTRHYNSSVLKSLTDMIVVPTAP